MYIEHQVIFVSIPTCKIRLTTSKEFECPRICIQIRWPNYSQKQRLPRVPQGCRIRKRWGIRDTFFGTVTVADV
jgi:hypothetical protein